MKKIQLIVPGTATIALLCAVAPAMAATVIMQNLDPNGTEFRNINHVLLTAGTSDRKSTRLNSSH